MKYSQNINNFKIKTLKLFFFITIIFKTNLFAQGGLTFISNDKPKNERTSYKVFEKNMVFENSLEVSFQMSFYSSLYIGEILTLINKENDQEYSLYYKYTYKQTNESFIQINRVGEEKLYEEKIPEDLVVNGSWIDVKIIFDFTHDKINFYFNGKKIEISEKFGLKKGSFDLVFGKHGIYVDVPSFKIRQLQIKSPKRKIHFPLNQREGSSVYDKSLKYVGNVSNPYWLIGDYFYWKEIDKFKLSDAVDIVFNEKNSSFYFLADTYLLKYNILKKELDSLPYDKPPKFVSSLTGKAIIDYETNSIYVYKTSMKEVVKNSLLVEKLGLKINSEEPKISPKKNNYGTIAILNLNNLQWKEVSKKSIFDEMRFHNNSIFQNDTKKLLLFGGYSNFTYHNDFKEYDFESNVKTELQFSGDTISPRFFSGHTLINSNKLLIYGGVGNLSGEEHIGKKYFDDLYEINLEKKVIKKKWSKKTMSYDSASSENMVMSLDNNYFYNASFAENLLNTNIQLKKVDVNTGSSTIIGDSISFRTNKFPNEIDLYQLKESNRLVIYKKEFLDNMMQSSEVSFYSIEFEPVTYERFDQGQAVFINYWAYRYLIFIPLSLLFILSLVFIIKRKHKKKKDDFSEYLFVRSNRQNIKIFIKDIWVVEALKDYIKIVCKDKNYVVHTNLSKFIEKLPKDNFIQIHRSFVVNIHKISSIDGDLVYLDKKYYKLGGKYVEQLKVRLNLK